MGTFGRPCSAALCAVRTHLSAKREFCDSLRLTSVSLFPFSVHISGRIGQNLYISLKISRKAVLDIAFSSPKGYNPIVTWARYSPGRRRTLHRSAPPLSIKDRRRSMRIIIVGCGKVGSALAEQLSAEGHELTLIDLSERRLE